MDKTTVSQVKAYKNIKSGQYAAPSATCDTFDVADIVGLCVDSGNKEGIDVAMYGKNFILYGQFDAPMTLLETDESIVKVALNHGSLFALTTKKDAAFVRCLDCKEHGVSGTLEKLAYRSIPVAPTCIDLTFNGLELLLPTSAGDLVTMFPVFPARMLMKEEEFISLREYYC